MTEVSVRQWVFLRGLAREAQHWGTFPKKFQESFPGDRVHLLDLPGTGVRLNEATPATIQGMMRSARAHLQKEIGSGPFHFFALSLGGMVTLAWMNQFPDEVGGAVIINSSSRLSSFYHRLRWESWKSFLSSMTQLDVKSREWGVLQLVSNNEKNREKILPLWVKIGRQAKVSPKTLFLQLSAAGRYRVPVCTLGDKALFVSGLGDRLVEPICSEDLARHFQAPIVRHPWAGHDIPIDDPDWMVQQVRDWLENSSRIGATMQRVKKNDCP